MKTWKLDPAHSEILFKIKYLKLTSVIGRVGDFQVKFQTHDESMDTLSNLQFTAAASSISTFNIKRDEKLQSPEFLDPEQHPQISFKATDIDCWQQKAPFHLHGARPPKEYKVYGQLTIKGIIKPVMVTATFAGMVQDENKASKVGFNFHTRINRNDFNVGWGDRRPAGSFILSDEIEIDGEIQLLAETKA